MRVFLALQSKDLDSGELDRLILGSGIASPHRPKDRHLTLSFMGEVNENELSLIIAGVDQVMASRSECSVIWSPTQVRDFPSSKPKVWAWQGPMSASLRRIYDELARLPILRLSSSHDEFRAHVSFAYLNQPSGLSETLPRHLTFHELVLCRSFSQEERQAFAKLEGWAQPRYEKLRSWNV